MFYPVLLDIIRPELVDLANNTSSFRRAAVVIIQVRAVAQLSML
jgi:hypothetical protein